jgi:hypothetical protein
MLTRIEYLHKIGQLEEPRRPPGLTLFILPTGRMDLIRAHQQSGRQRRIIVQVTDDRLHVSVVLRQILESGDKWDNYACT